MANLIGFHFSFCTLPDTDSLFTSLFMKVIVFEFTVTHINYISWIGYKIHFLKFITKPKSCRRKITESRVISISFKVLPKIWRSSKNIFTWIIKHLSTDIRTFNNLVKTLGAGSSPKERQKNLYKIPSQWHLTNAWGSLSSGTLKHASYKSILHL